MDVKSTEDVFERVVDSKQGRVSQPFGTIPSLGIEGSVQRERGAREKDVHLDCQQSYQDCHDREEKDTTDCQSNLKVVQQDRL